MNVMNVRKNLVAIVAGLSLSLLGTTGLSQTNSSTKEYFNLINLTNCEEAKQYLSTLGVDTTYSCDDIKAHKRNMRVATAKADLIMAIIDVKKSLYEFGVNLAIRVGDSTMAKNFMSRWEREKQEIETKYGPLLELYKDNKK